MLWVYDKRAGKVVRSAAGNVAWQIGLYDARGWPFGVGRTADDAWGYESRLGTALDRLVDRAPLDGAVWVEVLVPFVAGLLMRAPDFADSFEARLDPRILDWLANRGMDRKLNAELARFLDFQLLLAPLMAMNWTVLHFSTEGELITSDRAYTGTVTPLGLGVGVPLDRHTVLVITRSMGRTVLYRLGGQWIAGLAHFDTADMEAPPLRRAIAAHARTAVYGHERELVEEVAGDVGTQVDAHILPLGGAEDVDWGCHMYDYFRVISAMYAPGGATQADADTIDWSRVKWWTAPVVAEVLFPERMRGGVRVTPDRIEVALAFGAVIRRARRASGDFRLGAHALLPLDHIRTLPPPFPRMDHDRAAKMDAALAQHARREVVIALLGRALIAAALLERMVPREAS